MKPTIIFLIGAFSLLWVATVDSFAKEEHAAAAMALFEARFKEMDANGDGKISREEYTGFIMKSAMVRFDKADKDNDGYVTEAEAEEAFKARTEEMREKMKEWKEKREELREMKKQPKQKKGDAVED